VIKLDIREFLKAQEYWDKDAQIDHINDKLQDLKRGKSFLENQIRLSKNGIHKKFNLERMTEQLEEVNKDIDQLLSTFKINLKE